MIFNYKLSDESINSKGFIVETEGIDLESFNNNPVALHNHDMDQVIGHWENVRINEMNSDELIGTIVFDYSDPDSQKIMNKVAKNLIKHVSIGIKIIDFYDDIIDDEDVIVITKSELFEASVTPLPANKNAIKLTYNGESIKDVLEFNNKNNNNMSKVLELTTENTELKAQIETFKASTEDAAIKETELNDSIELKAKEVEDLNAQVLELKAELQSIEDAKETAKFNDMLTDAIDNGKIKEDQKENFLKLSFENAELIISGLESKVIEPEVKLTDIKPVTKTGDNIKTFSWYQENDQTALDTLYLTDRKAYNKLYDNK